MYTFEGFTRQAGRAVNGALRRAGKMGHTWVGTEHLLLALAGEDTGEAAAFLREKQVYAFRLGRLLAPQGAGAPLRLTPRDFTDNLKKCLDLAALEAKADCVGERGNLKNVRTGAMHLLTAMLELPCTGRQMLQTLGVEPRAAAREYGRRGNPGRDPLGGAAAARPQPRAGGRTAEKYAQDLTALAMDGLSLIHICVLLVLSIVASLITAIFSLLSLDAVGVIGNLVLTVFLFGFSFWRWKSGKVKLQSIDAVKAAQ